MIIWYSTNYTSTLLFSLTGTSTPFFSLTGTYTIPPF
eukprot:SAG22_NODE_830_length_6941_cov_2.114294_1_plen_36_part_10